MTRGSKFKLSKRGDSGGSPDRAFVTRICVHSPKRVENARSGAPGMAKAPATGRKAYLFKLSKNGNHGPMCTRWRQGWWPVSALRHDACPHSVIGRTDLCPPASCNTTRPLWRDNDPFFGASDMESQALGLADWVSGNLCQKSKLCIEPRHVDRNGRAASIFVAKRGPRLKVRPATIFPRADFSRSKPAQAEPAR
jgi:hypothetical protein